MAAVQIPGPFLGALYIVGIPAIPDVFGIPPLDQFQILATSLGWLFIVVQFPGGFAVGIGNLRNRIVDAIARAHGGSVVLASAAGRGTTATLSLPHQPAVGPAR